MGQAITEANLFKPKASKAESKADITNHAARAIIDDEAAKRAAKSARLRAARLENEAKLAEIAPPAKPAAKKKAAPKRAKPAAKPAK